MKNNCLKCQFYMIPEKECGFDKCKYIDNIIFQISKIRENNNSQWMKILKLALEKSPDEAKEIFKQITENDQKINELSRELCK